MGDCTDILQFQRTVLCLIWTLGSSWLLNLVYGKHTHEETNTHRKLRALGAQDTYAENHVQFLKYV